MNSLLLVTCFVMGGCTALKNVDVSGLTKCHAEVKKSTLSGENLPVRFTPVCKADGGYNPLQCHDYVKACWCVNPATGVMVDGSFQNIEKGIPKCDCDITCNMVSDPVCGTDGETYNSDCQLRLATCKSPNIKKAYHGVCKPPTVHGGYTAWSEFGKCTRSCGGGLHFRIRYCTNPTPHNGGQDCSHIGDAIESKGCGNNACPVDGGYTKWSNYSACTQSCGGGSKFRTRCCTNPRPVGGGRNCSSLGDSVESMSCNNHVCPVNGGYTEWSDYGVCTRSCGGGLKFRIRHCTNPVPENGGDDCPEGRESVQSVACNNFNCTVLVEMVQDAKRGTATKGFSTHVINLSLICWIMWAIIYHF